MLSRTVTAIVVGVVTMVWVSNWAATLFVDGYRPDAEINGIFMAVVGGVLGLATRTSNGTDATPTQAPRTDAGPAADPQVTADPVDADTEGTDAWTPEPSQPSESLPTQVASPAVP